MEKKTISVHALTVHIYTIAIVVLLLLIAVLGVKYWHLKLAVQNYTRSTIWMNQQGKPTGQISDYAVILAESTNHISSSDLQTFVTSISKELNRDIVVLDKNQKVLADTIIANKGTTYASDKNLEVKTTISDGKTRTFEERSKDYPDGIIEIVVPIKDAGGQITGAVLISDSQVFH